MVECVFVILGGALVDVVVWFCGASNASPGTSFYSRGRGFWSCFVLKASGAFNYSPLLLPGHLDGSPLLNNCPGYSRVAVYSFCLVLYRVLSYRDILDAAWYGLPRPND